MYNDEFDGQGGAYILDPVTGKRVRDTVATAQPMAPAAPVQPATAAPAVPAA